MAQGATATAQSDLGFAAMNRMPQVPQADPATIHIGAYDLPYVGPVLAVTLQGRWFYKESPEQVNAPGSYLFEPASSIHTLTIPEDQDGPTIAWFAVYGPNVNLDPDGKVDTIMDAGTLLDIYRAECRAHGYACDKVVVIG